MENKVISFLEEVLTTEVIYYVSIIEASPIDIALFSIAIDSMEMFETCVMLNLPFMGGFVTFNYKHIELDLDKSIVLVVNNSTIHSYRDIKDLALHLGSRNFRTFRTYKLGIINGTPIRTLLDLSNHSCGTRLALNTLTELKSKSLELYGK
jgi:hypothetical protein